MLCTNSRPHTKETPFGPVVCAAFDGPLVRDASDTDPLLYRRLG